MERFANKLTEMKHKKGAWSIAAGAVWGRGRGFPAEVNGMKIRTYNQNQHTKAVELHFR